MRPRKRAQDASPSQATALEIGAQADSALRAVRLVLGVLACFVLGAYRPLTGDVDLVGLISALAAIVIGVVVLNLLARRLPARAPWSWVLQSLDVAGAAGLAVALDEALDQQSWVLLVVPVVSAAVRHGSLASVLSWVGGCLAYLLAAWSGVVASSDQVTLLARVPGVLLAVAITVGLLARWMREGWEIQNELTEVVATRERRLAVIERTGLALNDLPTDEALELCANQTVALGFAAATVEHRDPSVPMIAIGDADLIGHVVQLTEENSAEPVVTVWVDEGVVKGHSVSMWEPKTRSTITGWSRDPIDEDHARALATLVAHTSTAIETTTLLRQLRHNAAHDDLTGLANRRTFDHELEIAARGSTRVAVGFVDLDDFKGINDKHGHDMGDKALVAVARRLESAAGEQCIVARYGGDEFVILMRDVGIDEARRVADAALQAAGDSIALGPLRITLGLSIGIAAARAPVAPAKLVRAADQALYRAKSGGKSTVVAVDLDELAASSVPYMPPPRPDADRSPLPPHPGGSSPPELPWDANGQP